MSSGATTHFYDMIVRETIKSGLHGDLAVWDVVGSIFEADANYPVPREHPGSLVDRAARVVAEATSNQHHDNWSEVMMEALRELLEAPPVADATSEQKHDHDD